MEMKILPSIKKIRGPAADSLLLTFVRVVTSILSIVIAKLMAVNFSLEEFGTYSQAMLIVTTATSLSIFGLTNAVNYFYNSSSDPHEKESYVSTIFSIQYVVGTFCAIVIMAGTVPLVSYFKNEDLKKVILFAAWMPMLTNLLQMLQVLFVSIGKAKLIAFRNFVVSMIRLAIVTVACYATKNVRTIFILTLALDIGQVIYFMIVFRKNAFSIRLREFRMDFLKPILVFSIPMAVYVLTNELSRDIDKYVISFFTDTSTLAIYSNAAKLLPFDLITASFITVLVPVITRQISQQNYEKAQLAFRSYLRIGYLGTWMVAFGVILNAREAMIFLYDDKYLPGLAVFVVYLFVDMIKFANTALILTAKGKSKVLMICSLAALGANAILNVLAYMAWGIIGPALTTLFVTLALIIVLLILDAKELHCSVTRFFDWKEMLLIIAELLLSGAICLAGKYYLSRLGIGNTWLLILSYCLYFVPMLLMNFKRIFTCLKTIGTLK